jgi:polysaccharide biosynthesis/export protein
MEAPVAPRYISPMTCVRHLISVACVALVLAGPAVAAAPAVGANLQAAPVSSAQIGADYRLIPGDQISIEVFGNNDLATKVNVAEDGTVHIPLAGAVAVGGLSPAEAARSIENALKAGQFLVNPQVTVIVVQSSSSRVSVLGEVAAPGRYPIEPNSTVFDLIALAGGITAKGSDVIYIIRKDASGVPQRFPVNFHRIVASNGASSAATVALQSGDSIEVPKATFFATGQVAQPGEYRIEGDMMLFEALARAGGVTPLGSASRVEVRRRGPDNKVTTVKVDKHLRIEPGDVIIVKERIF